VAPGIYTGLNVARELGQVDITGPVYIGAMTHIEDEPNSRPHYDWAKLLGVVAARKWKTA
jgi:hypothetical protein